MTVSFSACNAKKQLFSGSHAFNEDEPTSTNSKSVSKAYHQQHGANNGTSRHHNILLTSNSLRNNRGPTNKPPLACPLQNVTEVKGWGIKSCAPACTQDDDCKGENYKCSCDGPCGPTCNRIDEGMFDNLIQDPLGYFPIFHINSYPIPSCQINYIAASPDELTAAEFWWWVSWAFMITEIS